MTRYSAEAHQPSGLPPTTGVLLVNLGTPDAPTTVAVRRYLAEFLNDPRVVEFPRVPWWLVLHGVILRIRPPRVARLYRKIWSQQGSPLLAISRQQETALAAAFKQRAPGSVELALAMRYGRPSIEEALDSLRARGICRLVVLPLYPQYSATTTASVYDEVFRVLQGWRRVPELRLIQTYHDDAGYINALAASVREHWDRNGTPERLLMSFHGIPKRYTDAGDPYLCECQKTARDLAGALQLDDAQWQLAFQSRFGREEWLQPYADYTLKSWAKQGIRKVDIVCPGFSADCLETLEEISVENRDLFLAAGGQDFAYIPALNDREDHIQALAKLLERHMQGWDDAGCVESDNCHQRARHL